MNIHFGEKKKKKKKKMKKKRMRKRRAPGVGKEMRINTSALSDDSFF